MWSTGFLAGERGGDGVAGRFGEGRHAHVHRGVSAGGESVELGEFHGRAGEADLEAFDFAEPVLLLGLGDAVAEVVADLDQAGPLRGIGAKEGAAQVPLTEPAGRPWWLAMSTQRDFSAGRHADLISRVTACGGLDLL